MLISVVYREKNLTANPHLNTIPVRHHTDGRLHHPQSSVKTRSELQLVWKKPNITGWLGYNSHLSDDWRSLIVLQEYRDPVSFHVVTSHQTLLLKKLQYRTAKGMVRGPLGSSCCL